jgi:acyl-CoA synthetase (AMP-forming)/AMP-acid ligase II
MTTSHGSGEPGPCGAVPPNPVEAPTRRRSTAARRVLEAGDLKAASSVQDHERVEADLITWTRDLLAHYKCPVGVTFTAALARTASGKLQKQAIRSSLATSAVP